MFATIGSGLGGDTTELPSEARMVGAQGRRGHRWSKAGVTVEGGNIMLASKQDLMGTIYLGAAGGKDWKHNN